jgi:hypothetical protein
MQFCPETVDANSANRPTVPHAVRSGRYAARFKLTLSEGRELSDRMVLFLPSPPEYSVSHISYYFIYSTVLYTSFSLNTYGCFTERARAETSE